MLEAVFIVALLLAGAFVLYFMQDFREFLDEAKKQRDERRKK